MYKGLRKFEANTVGQDWVVGDIHGMYDMLMADLDRVGFNKKTDRLFGVGDLIDRGPDSPKCIRLLNEPWFFSVVGNHDAFILNRDYQTWMPNGGQWWIHETTESKIELQALMAEHAYTRFEVAHKSGKKFGIVHGEFPGNDWDDFDDTDPYLQESCMWGRTKFKMALRRSSFVNPVDNIDMLFHGHNILIGEILRESNQVWIDTGAYYSRGGYFTIINVDDYL